MATGSTIIMTENDCMTNDAWLEASKAIVKGYHLLPFMKENEDWFIAELLDGFKSHENLFKAHKICANQLIISLNKKSNLFHVNQGYDKLTAKNNKKNAVYGQCRAKKLQTRKSHIDQYNLVLTAMQIVRKPESLPGCHLFSTSIFTHKQELLFQSFVR
jgi:hypothetical protein